jgi:flavin-dependent dehydrogenase
MTIARINGAGISGSACARLMADAGLNVIGVATRRASAKGEFSNVLRSLSDDNHATPWINDAGKV